MARIGTVGYLNARPLSDRVDIDRHTLVLAHPAEVARMLRAGEVDAALVPVGALLAGGDWRVVPGVCIGAAGPVNSVVIAAETPPEQWRTVRLDGVSRSSVVLARLLLKHGPLAERVRPDLEVIDVPPAAGLADAGGDVAALVIGDAARVLEPRWVVRVDLAEVWHDWTGLPFVFAVWAGRPDLDPEVVRHLRDAGLAGVAAIRSGYAGDDLRYLTENLRYPLDDAALMGLRRFAALAHQAGLVALEDLELYGPPITRRARIDVDALLADAADGGSLDAPAWLLLARHAPLADLATAAEARRTEAFPGDTVPVRGEAVLADLAPVDSLDDAVAAGATRLRVPADRVAEVRARFPGAVVQAGGPGDDPAVLVSLGVSRAAEGDAGSAGWLDWAERAARAGLRLDASVAVGRGEGDEDLVRTLVLLRRLAESTSALDEVRVWAVDGQGAFGEQANTAIDHLRALALARLVLPTTVRVAASSETEGLGVAQASLTMGADHAGAVLLSGASSAPLEALEHQVRELGRVPVRESGPQV